MISCNWVKMEQKHGPDKTTSDIFPNITLIKVNQFDEQISSHFDEWGLFLKNEKLIHLSLPKALRVCQKTRYFIVIHRCATRSMNVMKKNTHHEASMHESHYMVVANWKALAEGEAKGKPEGLGEGKEKAEGLAEGELKGKR